MKLINHITRLVLSVLFFVAAAYADVTIDTYGDHDFISLNSSNTIESTSLFTSAALGDSRDVVAELLPTVEPGSSLDINPGIADGLEIRSGFLTNWSYEVTYDANLDASVLDPSGLGGIDFQVGAGDRFILRMFSDLPILIEVEVYDASDPNKKSTFSLARNSVNPTENVQVLYSSFASAGLNGGANFSNIGAIVLRLSGSEASDVFVSSFSSNSDVDQCIGEVKSEPGVCGCSVPDSDYDQDLVPDCIDIDDDNDGIIDTTEGEWDADHDGVKNSFDLDSDNDGILDIIEAGGVDSDNNGLADSIADTNGNGLVDPVDPEHGTALNPINTDADVTGLFNFLDIDSDDDGITDNVEAQVSRPASSYRGPTGSDSDNDGIDDAYDIDEAGGSPLIPVNTDGQDAPDYLDLDSENDTIVDNIEGHDVNRDGIADRSPLGLDSDLDGLDDNFDTRNQPHPLNATGSNAPKQDRDSDGQPDWRDTDDDNDTILTEIEGPGDPDNDGVPNYLDLDSDGDGTSDEDEGTGLSPDGLPDFLDPTCSFSGTVRLPNGEALPGARVFTEDGSYTATTNDIGVFTFPRIENGTYEFIVTALDGTVVGIFTRTFAESSCGGLEVVTAQRKVLNPVYFVWNSFLRQTNIGVLYNKTNRVIGGRLTLYDLHGTVLDAQNISIQPFSEFDIIVNDLKGYSTDTYGYVKVEYDDREALDGLSTYYRFTEDGSRTEFAIIKPFESVQRGNSYEFFNTFRPGTDLTQSVHQFPHWMQIVNLSETERKSFKVRIYDAFGDLHLETTVRVPPLGRRDVQAGHEVPGPNQLGLVEVIPVDQNAPYLAQLHAYGSDAQFATSSRTFSYALGSTTRSGLNYTQFVPISGGAGGQNWLALSNVGDQGATATVDILDRNGNVLDSFKQFIEPKGQRHFFASALLPSGGTGIAKIRGTRTTDRFIAKSNAYFMNASGRTTAAYAAQARPQYQGDKFAPYNTFLGQQNWIRLFNTTNVATTVTIEAFDIAGNSLGSRSRFMRANSGLDLELVGSLGFNVQANTYGVLKVTSSPAGAVFSDVVRISYIGSEVDIAKQLPIR